MNIAASQQDASAEDRKLMLLVQEFQKRTSAFTFSEYTEDRQKCIRQFIALTAQFSPQLRGVIVNLGAGDEMDGWEELFSDVSVAWDYDARLQENKLDAIELKRICHEIGPEVLRRVISLLLLALASKMVLREAYYGEEAEDDKDYVRDIATINEVSGQIEYGGGLAFLLKVAERERIGDTSELLDEFLVTSTIFYQILGSPEFDLHGAFDEFEKTLRRSVRLPYKKHAVSILIDELSKRKSKFVFASDPDKSDFVSFLDQSLKECWTINSSKRDRVVFSIGLAAVQSAFQKLGYTETNELGSLFYSAQSFLSTQIDEIKIYERECGPGLVQKEVSKHRKPETTPSRTINISPESQSENFGKWFGYGLGLLIIISFAKCAMN